MPPALLVVVNGVDINTQLGPPMLSSHIKLSGNQYSSIRTRPIGKKTHGEWSSINKSLKKNPRHFITLILTGPMVTGTRFTVKFW